MKQSFGIIVLLCVTLLAINSYAQDAIHVSDLGKVGIGNNDPQYKLDVNGNIKATSDIVTDGSLNAKGIRVTGNIVASDSLNAKSIKATGNITTDGTLTAKEIKARGNIATDGTLSAKGNIKTERNIFTDSNIILRGTHLTYNSLNGVIDWGDRGAGTLFFRVLTNASGTIANYKNCVVMNEKGFMGIGTTTPEVPLSVTITKGGTNNSNYVTSRQIVHSYGGVMLNGSSNYGKCSIYATGDIVTNNTLVSTDQVNYSDMRLKKDIHLTSSANDLATLRKIEIVDYKMIDTIADNKRYKKVIAQQVQKVYPQAVSPYSYYLPSVFQSALCVENEGDNNYRITVTADHHLTAGDKVKLKCYPGGDVIVTVKEIPAANQFIAISETEIPNDSSVFVYGKETDDLLTVDYSALSMLNVSATQELVKIIEAQQQKINRLTEENTTAKVSFENLEARINALEARAGTTNAPVTVLK